MPAAVKIYFPMCICAYCAVCVLCILCDTEFYDLYCSEQKLKWKKYCIYDDIWHLLSHKHAQVLYVSYSSISLCIYMAKIYLEERGRSIQVNGKAKKKEAAFSGFWFLCYFPVSIRLERCLSIVAPHVLLLFQPLYSTVPLQSSLAISHFSVSDFFSDTAYLFSGLQLIQLWARERAFI
jgi:hypothetical protein